MRSELFVFFFFQAEDGIRDVAVTGVQTCALPIFSNRRMRLLRSFHRVKNKLPVLFPATSCLKRDQPEPGRREKSAWQRKEHRGARRQPSVLVSMAMNCSNYTG